MKKLIILVATMLTFATTAFAQLGSLSSDLVFTPITPCRIVDTRGAGGVIPAATSRVFKGWAANYTAQGGSATNCGLPQTNNIAALAVNFLVIVPAAEGWIAAWPVGTTMPLVSNLNYKANDVLANSAILKINQTTADFNVYTVASTHLAVDVSGYYSKPISAGSLECENVFNTVATVVPVGNVAVVSDSSIVSCPVTYTGINYIWDYAGGSGGIGIWRNVYGSNISFSHAPFSTVATGYANLNLLVGRRCCRIPGR